MLKVSEAKKLVSVVATFASVTGASKEAQEVIVLDRVLCIYHLMQFRKDLGTTIWALINSGSEINAMILVYTKKLGFWTQKINVRAQKIDGLLLENYEMVIAGFQVKDKLNRVRFF